MSTGEIAGLCIAIAALITAGLSAAQVVSARRSAKDTTRVAERINEFEIMDGTIRTLRENLDDAQKETERLRTDLGEARKETQKLQAEVTVALANVAILSDHIRAHVPEEVPFPRMRRVSNG